MNDNIIKEIENIIGYTFKDKSLLVRAFTHSSKNHEPTQNYQSLEFLGDSIVDFIVAKRLMEIFPNAKEGELTVIRSKIVSKEPLAKVIDDLDLEKYLSTENGLKDIYSKPKIMSDIFEAITAAIYYDSNNDINQAEKFIISKLAPLFNEIKVVENVDNSKSILKEYCDKQKLIVEYELIEKNGPDHDPRFKVSCRIGNDIQAYGVGKNKKEAEQDAANKVLKFIFK